MNVSRGWFLAVLVASVANTSFSKGPEIPWDVPMNKAAGRWSPIIIPVRLENGEELPLMLTTGSGMTVLDKSLRGKVGGHRKDMVVSVPDGTLVIPIHAAPKLRLGGAAIKLKEVAPIDRSALRMPAIAQGCLGVDFLREYCVQLDFQNSRIRFMKPGDKRPSEWGTMYPLTWVSGTPFIEGAGVGTNSAGTMVSTADYVDRCVPSAKSDGGDWSANVAPDWTWNGATYTNILVRTQGDVRILGLRFLSRHLVTLDFGSDRIFLKRITVGPPIADRLDEAEEFLKKEQQEDRLPGWRRFEDGDVYADPEIPSTLAVKKTRDASIFRYTLQNMKDGWKVLKAWRTDEQDHFQEEYSVKTYR